MFCRLGGKLPPTHIEPQRYIYIFIHFSPGAKSSIYLPTKDAANCVNRICSRGFRFVVFVEFKMTLVNVSRSTTSSACIHNISTSPWSPLYEAMALCAPEMSYLLKGTTYYQQIKQEEGPQPIHCTGVLNTLLHPVHRYGISKLYV